MPNKVINNVQSAHPKWWAFFFYVYSLDRAVGESQQTDLNIYTNIIFPVKRSCARVEIGYSLSCILIS